MSNFGPRISLLVPADTNLTSQAEGEFNKSNSAVLSDWLRWRLVLAANVFLTVVLAINVWHYGTALA